MSEHDRARKDADGCARTGAVLPGARVRVEFINAGTDEAHGDAGHAQMGMRGEFAVR